MNNLRIIKTLAASFLALFVSPIEQVPAAPQTIDFEALPTGGKTSDLQSIWDEYAAFGVLFEVVNDDEELIGFPLIAKVGPPLTAFVGCPGADEPQSGQGLGMSFLTDNNTAAGGPIGSLLISYISPVNAASGRIIDTERRADGTYEQFTVTARNQAGQPVGSPQVVTAPVGPNPPCSVYSGVGPGDGLALPWSITSPTGSPEIHSILIRYTGTAPQVGLAFDDFSPSSVNASCTQRIGEGGNPTVFSCVTNPVLGTVWSSSVDITTSGAAMSILTVLAGGPTGGTTLTGTIEGEVLCLPPILLIETSSTGLHNLAIPANPALSGLQLWTQAATLEVDGVQLSNALDLILGTS